MDISLEMSLTGAAALIGALVGAHRYWKNRQRSKGTFYRAFMNTVEINSLLVEAHRSLGVEHVISINVIEVTNGGGIPQPLKSIYMKSLTSTYAPILEATADKIKIDESSYVNYFKLIIDGYFLIETKDLSVDYYKRFNEEHDIKTVITTYVKQIKNDRLIVLTIDLNVTKEELMKEHFDCIIEAKTLAKKIKELI